MVVVVTTAAVPATIAAFAEHGIEAMLVGQVVDAGTIPGAARYVEGPLEGPLGEDVR
jgi:hypothetical protein